MIDSVPKILVVDDDDLEPLFFKHEFPEYDISSTNNIDKAIIQLRNFSFDFILLDQLLGPVKGIDELHRLREFSGDTRIIVYTNQMYEGMTEEAQSKGAFTVVKKGALGGSLLPDLLELVTA